MAEIDMLDIGNGMSVGSIFPCKPKKINAITGQIKTDGLSCHIKIDNQTCMFILTVQPLNIAEYRKSGKKFLKEMHHNYALGLDKNYRRSVVLNRDVEGYEGLTIYKFLFTMQGIDIVASGQWFVKNNYLIRESVNCDAENLKPALKKNMDLFFVGTTYTESE